MKPTCAGLDEDEHGEGEGEEREGEAREDDRDGGEDQGKATAECEESAEGVAAADGGWGGRC